MKLNELAERIGAKIITPGKHLTAQIDLVYAGDRMSDLVNHGSDGTLLVSNLASTQLLRVAELMDVPGVCLLNGISPEPELVDAASRQGILLMVSPAGMFETCGLLYQCMVGANKTSQ